MARVEITPDTTKSLVMSMARKLWEMLEAKSGPTCN